MAEHLRLASDRESLDASEPPDLGLCDRCGHALDFHRTDSFRCTAQVLNEDTICDLCGGKLVAGWLPTDKHHCSGCGAQTEQWVRCGCVLRPRIAAMPEHENGFVGE